MDESIRVLLVDDEESFVRPLSQRLSTAGFEVETASSGPDALAKAQKSGGNFHVLVIGQVMAPPDGIETMRRLHLLYPAIVTIILTGWGDMEDGLRAMQSGAYRYMRKPISVDELVLNIQVAARFNRERRQSLVLRLLLDISRAMQGALKTEDLLDRMLKGIQALGYDRARVYVLNNERAELQGWTQVGGSKLPFGQIRIPVDEYYTRHLFEAGRPCIFQSGQYPDPYCEILDKVGLDEWAELPLIWEGTIIGKMIVDNKISHHPLATQELDELALFAAQAAAAIGRTQRIEGEQNALRSLAEAGRTISGARTMERLCTLVWRLVRQLLPSVDGLAVCLYDEQNKVLSFPFWRVGRKRLHVFPSKADAGIDEYVLEAGMPLLLRDGDTSFRAQHGLQPAFPEVGPSTSEIAVPMLLDGRPLGCIDVMTNHPGIQYNDKDLELLQALASQVVVAIQNVQQLEEGESLRKASAALAKARGKEAVLRAIVSEGHRLIQSDFTGLVVQNEDGMLVKAGPVKPRTYSTRFDEPRQQGGVSRAVVESCQPMIIPDTSQASLVKESVRHAGIRSILAMPLTYGNRGLGVLFAHTFEFRRFSRQEINLWTAFASQVAAVLHNTFEEERQAERTNQRLRAVLSIFQAYRERKEERLILADIARAAQDVLDVDVCTLLEYDPKKKGFTERAAAGLNVPDAHHTPPNDFETWFLDKQDPTVIPDVPQHERLRNSDFVRREGILSTVVHPLRVEDEPLGLLFASYRRLVKPTKGEMEGIRLFADLAASVLHEARLRDELASSQMRLQRRTFLTWVSMLEDTWRHSIVQKVSAIRNYAGALLAQLPTEIPVALRMLPDEIAEIDRLATEIASAPPRVPQSWEMQQEPTPLAALMTSVVQSQDRLLSLQGSAPVGISLKIRALGDARIWGYRRWLAYALEALIQNSRNAMPAGGKVTINGRRVGQWAEVRIRDLGPGVPQDIRKRLFKESIRKDQDASGMGLGALLAAVIIEEHGGTIRLERTGSKGTSVLIRLPVADGP